MYNDPVYLPIYLYMVFMSSTGCELVQKRQANACRMWPCGAKGRYALAVRTARTYGCSFRQFSHRTYGPYVRLVRIDLNYRLSISYWLTCLRLLSPSVGGATPTIMASTLAL